MARNILLTSMSALESEHPVRYFSAKKESGYEYCDAVLSVEASTKYVLARLDIDEIIVLGRNTTFDENDDGRSITLKEGSSFYSADIHDLSAYSLYRYRIAQYIEKQTIKQQGDLELLPKEEQDKVKGFIHDFFKNKDENGGEIGADLYFDVLARDRALYETFKKELCDTVPGAGEDPGRYMRWANTFLYSIYKETGKLKPLPVNEDVLVRFMPAMVSQSSDEQEDRVALIKAIFGNDWEINLYVSLHTEDAGDTFFVMNILEILNSMPGGHVNVKGVFTVSGADMGLAGEIHDNTYGFGITELVAANRTFLRYGKADMIVDFWEKSGERNEQLTSMVYAMRHIDVGLSMCNMREVEEGLIRLRELLRSDSFQVPSGYSGQMLGLIAYGIAADYGPLLEGDEISFLEMVKWAYRHHFYQQTLTLIESRVPENLVNTGIFYYCDDEEEAAHVTRLLAQIRLQLKPYEYYKMDDIDHYFIKAYDKARVRRGKDRRTDSSEAYADLRIESLTNTDPNVITGHTACEHAETLKDLLYAYYRIGGVRNKMNHAEDSKMPDTGQITAENEVSPALLWVKENIDLFITSYEKALKEVEGKRPNIVKITSADVRSCAEQLWHDRRKPKDLSRS